MLPKINYHYCDDCKGILLIKVGDNSCSIEPHEALALGKELIEKANKLQKARKKDKYYTGG